MRPSLVRLAVAGAIVWSLPAQGFNVSTHRLMNETAVTNDSALESFLQTKVGLRGGVEEHLLGQSVARWISEGGEREDDWTPLPGRFFRHFHDPLRPWSSAGLGHGLFDSSIVWMQEPQGWSWQEARSFYYAALTARSAGARDQQWADALRAVGQVMHLIEDAAQPAHTRNDQHGMEFVCRNLFRSSCGGNFEYWVSDHASAVPLTGGGGFDHDILSQPTGHSEAPVPVARLIDTDTYDGAVAVVGPSLGIAEFTNANFFSEDTISNVDYPFPSLDSNALVAVTELSVSGFPRQYYTKAGGYGSPVELLLAEAVFDETVSDSEPIATVSVRRGVLDERVWEVYAKTLVPKAVDYAQGALDYFFRGQIDFVPDPNDANGFLIKNLGPEDLNGTFELYSDDGTGDRQLVPGSNGWELSIPTAQHCPNGAACNQSSVQAFDAPFEPPPSGTYTLVFHGTMGNEASSNGSFGAVAAKVVQSSPFLLLTAQSAYRSAVLDRGWQRIGSGLPVPVDYDGSSRICLNGCRGIAINGDTIVFNRLGDASSCTDSPYYWDGINTVLLSTDGGRTFSDQSPTIYSTYSVRPANMIHLGGGKLLGSYYSQTCWSDWIDCPWPGYPNVTGCVSCTPFDPAFRYGEECRNDYNGPWGTMYSEDLGATWQLRPGVGISSYYIGDHTLVAGLPAQSTDDGLTWATVDVVVDGQPAPDLYIFGLAWNRKVGDERVLLALAWPDPSASTIALLKSNDGIQWRLLQSFAQHFGPPYVDQPESLAIGPDGSALMTVWVYEYGYRSAGHYVVYASQDAGETWYLASVPAGGSSLPTAAYSMGVVYVGSDAPAL